MRPASVRKLHHRLASWVNTDALHGLGDAANFRKRTFMVRVQNQPVNPVVLVASFGGARVGGIFLRRVGSVFATGKEKAAPT
ncbi:hypothetical protein [Caballeronia sp. 15711]|uniref:hypothetical protein n=1 Tax=Caballeronia sp. 15711 TaxID=3391029 RepID=UPI0039E53091